MTDPQSSLPLAEPKKDSGASLVAVGDVMLSRRVAEKMRLNGFDYPFEKMKDFLMGGDLVFGNLETPITAGRDIRTGEMIFRADAGSELALKNAGFAVLSLANNHTPNFGAAGLRETFRRLRAAGIAYAGAGENEAEALTPAYVEAGGLRFAFLAFNDSDVVPPSYGAGDGRPGTALMDIPKMTAAVAGAKKEAALVIVSMHSGVEYAAVPNARQTAFARAAVEAGAEMVIGHHPHVVQTAEKYRGKWIFYSLGNFVFDQMWSEDTRRGLAVKAVFGREGVKRVELAPVLIEDFSQPRPLAGPAAEKLLSRLGLPVEKAGENGYILRDIDGVSPSELPP